MDLFENYVKKYDMNDTMIKRKYHHSFRVQTLCELIAKDLDMDAEDIRIASLCGIFHDIARFKQAKLFHTFNDLNSINHGDEGAIIFQNEFSDKLGLDEEKKQIIIKAIKYHNKINIGDDVNEKEELFCKILRDADKVDVLYLLATDPGLLKETDGPISEECEHSFMNKQSINIKAIKNGTEKNILSLAFLWNINFDISKKIIKDNKYYQKIKKNLNNEIYNKYFQLIYESLEV